MIFELTLGKVEQYLLVVEMIMGLCADVYIHGRLEPGLQHDHIAQVPKKHINTKKLAPKLDLRLASCFSP